MCIGIVYFPGCAVINFEINLNFLVKPFLYMINIRPTFDPQSAQISQEQDGHNTYVIMKTICTPAYHQNSFVAT